MCCSLQFHVRFISIVCIVLTALASLNLFVTITASATGESDAEIPPLYHGSAVTAICVQVAIYAIHIAVYVLCLIGSNKRNKLMLIPFLILKSIHILVCIGLGIYLIFLGAVGSQLLGAAFGQEGTEFGVTLCFILLIPVAIAFWLTVYFIVIVAKFINEIEKGIHSGHQEGMVLETYNKPVQQGVVHGPGGTQNVTYHYQQQAPPGTQNVAYQYPQQAPLNPDMQQGYQPGAKHPV